MDNTQTTLPRHFKSCRNIPAEIVNRLNQVKNQSLREQRNTFSMPQLHGRVRCRWSSHLLELPYFHIIESDDVKTEAHLLLFRHRKILTLRKEFGNWNIHKLTPEEFVAQIVPNRHLRTGHLCKTASRSKMESVAVSLGMKRNQIPVLTEANADIIRHYIVIKSDLKILRTLADKQSTELDLKLSQINTEQ